MQLFKQSPINIKTKAVKDADMQLSFNYKPQQFHVRNTGQNISLMPLNNNSFIVKNNKIYHLSEVHFHRPSEHQVDYQNFDMEVHIVNQEDHETVVYRVLLAFEDDGYDFGKPFENIDRDIEIDLSKLVAANCWDYHGSFTTTPYDEVVIWLINQQVLTIEKSQADHLNKLYPNNNRCLQPTNGRDVYSICTCSN